MKPVPVLGSYVTGQNNQFCQRTGCRSDDHEQIILLRGKAYVILILTVIFQISRAKKDKR